MRVDVTSQTVVHRPRAVVADYLFDPTNLAAWCADLTFVARAHAGPVAVGAQFLVGTRGRLHDSSRIDEITALAPLESMTLRTVSGGLPLESTFVLAPELRNSTMVTWRVLAEPRALSMVTAPLMERTLRRTSAADLARLKTLLEAARPV